MKKGLFMLGLAVAAFATAALLYGLASRVADAPSVPLQYEEKRAPSSRMQEYLLATDHALYDALYENGTRERDVFFSKVVPRKSGGDEWEFTEMVVRCEDRDAAARLGDKIEGELSTKENALVWREEGKGAQRIVLSVSSLGRLTHRLILDFSPGPVLRGGGQSPRVAIIIDDMGYDPALARVFMGLEIPVAISVLPHAPYSRTIAREAGGRGIAVMLHLPMQPRNYPDNLPGEGALMVGMEKEKILKVLTEDLEAVPGAVGVNNHMGSLFTEDREKMGIVLGELKRRGLFFVDSRTSKRSVAYSLAREMGVPALRRQVFLDHSLRKSVMRVQMDRLRSIAGRRGKALGIAHPHRETLEMLVEDAPWLQGIAKVVPVSELLD